MQTTLRKLRKYREDKVALITLFTICVVTHLPWLFVFKIFTSGDWNYITPEKYEAFFHFSPIWFSDGLGGTSATPSFYLIRFFEGAMSQFGAGFMLNEKLFFLLPISFVGTFGTYFMLRQYFVPWASSIGALVFTFNTALLFNYAGPLTIGMVDALTPLAILLFMKLLRDYRNKKLLIANGVMLTLMMAYELRITIIVGAIFAGYLVFKAFTSGGVTSYLRPRSIPLVMLGVLVLALNAYWLVPYILGAGSGVTFSNVFDEGLFTSYSNVLNALTLSHPFWTGSRPATFVVQPIPIYAWILPVIAFCGFALIKFRKEHDKDVIFWALLCMVGFFLIKQVNEPLVDAYPWIFENVPGFTAFRESSKFYLITALCYSVLIPFGLIRLRLILKRRNISFNSFRVPGNVLAALPVAAILIVIGLNMLPLVSGSLKTLYTPKEIPQDYQKLDSFVNGQDAYFRTLWLPTSSRWAPESVRHPKVNASSAVQGEWNNQVTKKDLLAKATIRDKTVALLSDDSSQQMLSAMSVKYVIVPSRDVASQDDFFRYYGDDRDFYLDAADNSPFLRKVDVGTGDIAVYENTRFKDNFYASNDLQQFTRTQNVNVTAPYDLVTGSLKQEYSFMVKDPAKSTLSDDVPTRISDLFSDIHPDDIKRGSLQTSVSDANKKELYYDTYSRPVIYDVSKGVFSFSRDVVAGVRHGDKAAISPSLSQEKISEAALQPGSEYYLVAGQQVKKLADRDFAGPQRLGDSSVGYSLLRKAGSNVVNNPSFEKGLWQSKVEDCNKYDDNPDISMHHASESTDGKKGLMLGSLLHTACTTTDSINVRASEYVLHFSHKTLVGSGVGYRASFDNGQVIEKRLDSNTKWSEDMEYLSVPQGVKTMKLTLIGYPNYQLKSKAFSVFDDVSLVPVDTIIKAPALESPERFAVQDLKSEPDTTLSIPMQAGDGGERVKNGGFSQGLWQKQVFDCNDYDDTPVIGMKLGKRDASDSYVELEARRHNACTTSENIPLEQGYTYLLSFKYQSDNAKSATYTIKFNDQNGTFKEENVPIKDTEWHTYAKQIQAPLGATSATITVYANGGERGNVTFRNRYDDVSLRRLPGAAGQYYMVSKPDRVLKRPEVIIDNISNPTRKQLRVQGATTPFYLNYSATFNPLWRLELDNSKLSGMNMYSPFANVDSIDSSNHYRLNDYLNGWYVDPERLCADSKEGCTKNSDGSYDIKLMAEFTSQRWFYAGSVLSLATLVVITVILLLPVGTKKRGSSANTYNRK